MSDPKMTEFSRSYLRRFVPVPMQRKRQGNQRSSALVFSGHSSSAVVPALQAAIRCAHAAGKGRALASHRPNALMLILQRVSRSSVRFFRSVFGLG